MPACTTVGFTKANLIPPNTATSSMIYSNRLQRLIILIINPRILNLLPNRSHLEPKQLQALLNKMSST